MNPKTWRFGVLAVELVLAFPLFAQTPVPTHSIEYFPGGKVKSEGLIEGDNKEGLWKFYWNNGLVKAEGSYSEGWKIGIWSWYYENGKKKATCQFDESGESASAMAWYEDGKKQFSGTFQIEPKQALCEKEMYFLKGTSWFENGTVESEVTGNWVLPNDDEEKPVYLISYVLYWPNGKVAVEHHEDDPAENGGLRNTGAIPTVAGFYFPDGRQFLAGSYGHEYEQEGVGGTHWPSLDNNVFIVKEKDFIKKDTNVKPYKPVSLGIDGSVSIDMFDSMFMEDDLGENPCLDITNKKNDLNNSKTMGNFKNGGCVGAWIIHLFPGSECEIVFDEHGLIEAVNKIGEFGNENKVFCDGFLEKADIAPSNKHHFKVAK